MFEQIEKQYKRQLKENQFSKFYWINATISILLTIYLKNFFKNKVYVIYIIFAILIIIYIIIDYKKTLKGKKIYSKASIIKRIDIYATENYNQRINNLISNIKKYNIKTKNDIKLTIDYFNSKMPVKIESNHLGWFVSSVLTISSFIQVAYDSKTQTLDYSKISVILSSSIGIIAILLIPILTFKTLIISIIFSKEKLHSNISADLTYIYFNFDKYKNQLNK